MGIRDFLPHELEQRLSIVQRLEANVKGNGFERIVTPSIEIYDAIEDSLGRQLKNNCIVFFDGSGARLALRPDHSAAICRIVASKMLDQLPVQLYYYDPVFRKDAHLGETEIYQFGVEHIGRLTIEGDAKMLQMVVDMCHSLGLKDIQVHVSHPSLFESQSLDFNAIQDGVYTELKELPTQEALSNTSNTYFQSLFKIMKKTVDINPFVINYGLVKDLSYYNGVYFDVVVPGFGKVIASGGRYDSVIQSFGVEANAIGVAFNMFYLEQLIHE